jgi:hypothetical protein
MDHVYIKQRRILSLAKQDLAIFVSSMTDDDEDAEIISDS